MSRGALVLRRLAVAALLCGAGVLGGCASGGSGQVHGSVYMGVSAYDPWYWGPCCHDTVIVGPPPPSGARPDAPHVEHPIAKPPPSAPAARPLPAQAAPRPAAMPRGGGGRRR